MLIFLAGIFICFFVFCLSSCTNEPDTVKTLQSVGFTDIKTTGYEFFACSQDDVYHTGFIAKNSRGEIVSGVVCCGLLFKGCTIRF
jgi:hypothetical protein